MRKEAFCWFFCIFLIFAAVCAASENESPKLSLRQTVKENGYKTTVYFDMSSSKLSLLSKDALMRAAKLQAISETRVYLTGYADKTGNHKKNLILSKKRAESAKNFLLSLGVKESNINIEYKGGDNPADDKETPEAYAKNRRVEVLLTLNGDKKESVFLGKPQGASPL